MGANPPFMGIKRAMGDLRELHQSVVELFDDDRTAEAEASLQIARSAQRFSQNTKEVVDDKLSFSATLMRAGEVQAANRLLAEVEHEVREEEAALIETVNEVKVAQSLRRERVTRLRLAKMLAVATIGSALLTFSAAGMAVAGFLRDRAEEVSRPQDETARVALASRDKSVGHATTERKSRRLKIGDVKVLFKPYYLFPPSGRAASAYTTTHGSPHPYDTHVPLIVYAIFALLVLIAIALALLR